MPAFEKVGKCLYRYVPTGKYYARFESNEREVRKSLRITDRALAKRNLADLQRATARTSKGSDKTTLTSLCDLYMAQEVATLRGQLHTLRLRRDDLCLVNFLDGMSDFLQEPPAKLTPVAVARYLGLRLDCIHVEHWASLPGSEALPPVPDAMEETINDIVLDHIRVVYREPDMAAFKGYLDFLAMAVVANENVAVPIPGVTKKGRITINRGRKSP